MLNGLSLTDQRKLANSSDSSDEVLSTVSDRPRRSRGYLRWSTSWSSSELSRLPEVLGSDWDYQIPELRDSRGNDIQKYVYARTDVHGLMLADWRSLWRRGYGDAITVSDSHLPLFLCAYPTICQIGDRNKYLDHQIQLSLNRDLYAKTMETQRQAEQSYESDRRQKQVKDRAERKELGAMLADDIPEEHREILEVLVSHYKGSEVGWPFHRCLKNSRWNQVYRFAGGLSCKVGINTFSDPKIRVINRSRSSLDPRILEVLDNWNQKDWAILLFSPVGSLSSSDWATQTFNLLLTSYVEKMRGGK